MVFLKWERLRIYYNVVLVAALLCINLTTKGIPLALASIPFVLLLWLLYGLAANFCFLAAPAVEAYAAWLGFRSRWITTTLFIGGVVISLQLVFIAVMATGEFLLRPD